MKHVRKSVLLGNLPHEIYQLVAGVEQYPQFLPWCERAEVLADERTDESLRLAGHLIEIAWLAAPGDPAIQTVRQRIFSDRAEAATSTPLPEEITAQEYQLKLYYAGKSSAGVRFKAGPRTIDEIPSMLAGIARSEVEVVERLAFERPVAIGHFHAHALARGERNDFVGGE